MAMATRAARMPMPCHRVKVRHSTRQARFHGPNESITNKPLPTSRMRAAAVTRFIGPPTVPGPAAGRSTPVPGRPTSRRVAGRTGWGSAPHLVLLPPHEATVSDDHGQDQPDPTPDVHREVEQDRRGLDEHPEQREQQQGGGQDQADQALADRAGVDLDAGGEGALPNEEGDDEEASQDADPMPSGDGGAGLGPRKQREAFPVP